MADVPRRTLTVVAIAAVGVIGATAGVVASPAPDARFVGPDIAETLAVGDYIGPCSIVTPPEPDPCQAAQLVLRYQLLGNIGNSAYHPKWVVANPGEVLRLATVMAEPRCSTVANPQPQTMRTFYGAALADAVEAYACALGTEAVTWPVPNAPPLAGAKDKTPPSAPGPILVGP